MCFFTLKTEINPHILHASGPHTQEGSYQCFSFWCVCVCVCFITTAKAVIRKQEWHSSDRQLWKEKKGGLCLSHVPLFALWFDSPQHQFCRMLQCKTLRQLAATLVVYKHNVWVVTQRPCVFVCVLRGGESAWGLWEYSPYGYHTAALSSPTSE